MVLLLDGPTGTELERRGVDASPSLWSARAIWDAPDVLIAIHRDYLAAGADILTTNTFRTNRRAAIAAGLTAQDARDLTRTAVRIARDARERWGHPGVQIAGSLAPVEDCYSPQLVPHDDRLRDEHADHIETLLDAGCDLILVETMNTVREAAVACEMCSRAAARYFVSFVPDQSGRHLMSGESLIAATRLVSELGPEAVLVNCCSPSAAVTSASVLAAECGASGSAWKFGMYPNGGEPHPERGYYDALTVNVNDYIAVIERALEMGASIVGTCCGTTPEYTQAIRRLLDRRRNADT